MPNLTPLDNNFLTGHIGGLTVPVIVADAGEDATKRFIEFFTAQIRNKNTRAPMAAPCVISLTGAMKTV